MHTLPLSNYVLVVGAGLSYPAPTDLPLGFDLTKFCLEHVIGENKTVRILKANRAINNTMRNDFRNINFAEVPRLESIIEACKDIETNLNNDISEQFQFTNGFKSFINRRFNKNHLLIAYFYSLGANIITLNFDDCILKAYEYAFPDAKLKFVDGYGVPIYKDDSLDNKIIHLHGIAYDCNTLGFAVKDLLKGFKPKTNNLIKNLLTGDNIFIFAGYSCSDSFDVNPLFESLKSENNSKMIYVDHGGWSETSSVLNFSKNFKYYSRISGDTTDILCTLLNNKNVINKIEKEFKEYEKNNKKSTKWIEDFNDHSKIESSDEVNQVVLMAIVDKMRQGYELLKIDRISDVESKYFKTPYILGLKSNVYRMTNKMQKYNNYYNRLNKKGGKDVVKYESGQNNKNTNNNVYEAIDTLKSLNYISWSNGNPVTKLQSYIRFIINKNILRNKIGLKKPKQQDINHLKNILNVVDEKSKMNINNFSSPTLICVLLRMKGIILSFLNKSDLDDKFLKESDNDFNTPLIDALEKYTDISLVEGVSSVYRDLALSHYIRSKFHSENSLLLSKHYLKASSFIAKISNSNLALKKSQRLKFLFGYYFLSLKNNIDFSKDKE